MASIACNNGPHHTHHSVTESKICWGILKAPTPPVAALPPVKMVTPAQLSYIENLGGNRHAARNLTRKAASELIDDLKKGTHMTAIPQPAPARTVDPKVAMIAGLIDAIPDGYFAVEEYDGGHVDFMRISRPKRNKYAGSIKIQTQHGDRLEVRAAKWPSGTLSIYDQRVVRMLLLLVADYRTASMRYARKLGRCCRCNAELTDDRSRHYGIGPECEKVFPWVIEEVDANEALARL